MEQPIEKISTADICDKYYNCMQVLELQLYSYGGLSDCHGQIVTFELNEDNRVLKTQLRTAGNKRIAVVNVLGSKCAVVGDRLAGFAIENNWAGIIINGYLRDSVQLKTMPIALWALGTHPKRSLKQFKGKVNQPLNFGGVEFNSGNYLYADEDGIVILEQSINQLV